jgi:hypothetical protein
MPIWLKAAGIGGSLLVIITLIITLLKNVIALVALIGTAIKVLVVVAFIALFIGVGFLVFRTFRDKKQS